MQHLKNNVLCEKDVASSHCPLSKIFIYTQNCMRNPQYQTYPWVLNCNRNPKCLTKTPFNSYAFSFNIYITCILNHIFTKENQFWAQVFTVKLDEIILLQYWLLNKNLHIPFYFWHARIILYIPLGFSHLEMIINE